MKAKFWPKKPVRNVIGRKMVATAASRRMTLVSRLETVERCTSSAPVRRSRWASIDSVTRISSSCVARKPRRTSSSHAGQVDVPADQASEQVALRPEHAAHDDQPPPQAEHLGQDVVVLGLQHEVLERVRHARRAARARGRSCRASDIGDALHQRGGRRQGAAAHRALAQADERRAAPPCAPLRSQASPRPAMHLDEAVRSCVAPNSTISVCPG